MPTLAISKGDCSMPTLAINFYMIVLCRHSLLISTDDCSMPTLVISTDLFLKMIVLCRRSLFNFYRWLFYADTLFLTMIVLCRHMLFLKMIVLCRHSLFLRMIVLCRHSLFLHMFVLCRHSLFHRWLFYARVSSLVGKFRVQSFTHVCVCVCVCVCMCVCIISKTFPMSLSVLAQSSTRLPVLKIDFDMFKSKKLTHD